MQPRYVMWRRQYDQRRYARHLTQAELNKRLREIFLNLLRLQEDAKIGVFPIDGEMPVWIEKWTHMLEEMQLRYGPYPNGFTREILHSELFPNFASELAGKAARAMSKMGLKPGDTFIKFGKRLHMEALYERGALRIQPASFFLEKDHNGAIRDDELALPISIALSRDDIIKLVRNPQDVPPDAAEHRVDVKFQSPTDYWLYCVSTSAEPRLFVDFNAEACVVIRNRTGFREKLREALEAKLSGAVLREGAAQYIDPLFPNTAKVFVPLAKHFGYAYQREYRFCWLPNVPVQKLQFVDLEMGSLTADAELVVL